MAEIEKSLAKLSDVQARSMASLKAEARLLELNPMADVYAAPVTDDFLHWTASISGPAGTPYEGGLFHLTVMFPNDFPLNDPKIVFKTKTLHPIVNTDGRACTYCILNGLPFDKGFWFVYGVRRILKSIFKMLSDPFSCAAHPDDEDAAMFTTSPDLYERKAKEWTQRYAMIERWQRAGG
eukprot:scpid85511/ scgid18478/ Ubiquitin-conjugating enzyme E2 D3; Ubiquitin carrier protein D3; Ubiquitin-conjugating enzyme E2(17)KB 3; Ubiquitin-conjugating enzyme E2-17 kDa 3; Ubiquitin-protein ligase D3 &gt; Ubiquitin-conjugating enzyme E2 D3; Phosphoarginine phosphatase; Ubiquitin carrier protein D3; Ubiquitin-conjugating enzyme E2(17)KB 3; Ubiquitin-conjugating enzyme E2-17 kDa 3; Ubiquitin-protein ligase D3 &gt; Ubiquitin-conjugating enzyme E2 D3; Ubiquitin carrier protein D3; Ubiquitin-conjuga